MSNIWQQRTNTFWPTTTALQQDKLTPGLYKYETSAAGWYLERTAEKYEFPYKIYGEAGPDNILKRIQNAWAHLQGNLGILLNGLKGGGKTITAQIVANWLIKEGIPVLVVSYPVPLDEILETVEQPFAVVFDEFEKTHSKPEDQQQLLSAIDGMSRGEFRRLFLFTTNEKAVDANFLDRPSRIRYCWEFGRLEEEVMEALLDDLLDPALTAFRPAIIIYLSTRKVLSIDVVKTVINEINIFREEPNNFAHILNLSEIDPRGFTLELLDSNRNPIRTLSTHFSPSLNDRNRLRAAITKSGREEYLKTLPHDRDFPDESTGLCIALQEPTNESNEWVCHVCPDIFSTWVGKFPKTVLNLNDRLWIDQKPPEWVVPEWAHLLEQGKLLHDEDDENGTSHANKYNDWERNCTVYGTESRSLALVRININHDAPVKFSPRNFITF